jgi:hypothetical protein
MKIVFIAAPFRAATPWGIAENVRDAERVALEVWRLGAVAVCPQANSALFHGEGPDQRYLTGYLALLARCDAVLVAGQSAGVSAELARAAELELPVFRDLASLSEWLTREEAPLFS